MVTHSRFMLCVAGFSVLNPLLQFHGMPMLERLQISVSDGFVIRISMVWALLRCRVVVPRVFVVLTDLTVGVLAIRQLRTLRTRLQ